ncbi:MAG: hypothetical protein ACREPM_05970, partial [Gemmatimonadaceae bacterium]
ARVARSSGDCLAGREASSAELYLKRAVSVRSGHRLTTRDLVTADFTLQLQEYQANDPASGDFVDLHAAVACRGFHGQTRFWISRRDVDRFLSDASNLSTQTSDASQLLGGWDDAQERLRLQVTRAGLSGQFVARVRIANAGPREEQWNRVETEFICPSVALSSFLTDLTRILDERAQGIAVLTGDPEAIA